MDTIILRDGLFRPSFERDRFVIVPQALPSSVIEGCLDRAQDMMQHSRSITRHEGSFNLCYRVVTGDAIRQHWPELFAFYQSTETLAWVRQITGESTVSTSEHLLSAVNLNIMNSGEAVYRWHFDAVAYTLLIYLTEVNPEDGGALELVPGCRPHETPDLSIAPVIRHFPTAGTVVLMDGTRCYHRVAPLLRASLRLSIPLVYPSAACRQRPAGLDSYLYEHAA